MSETVDGGLRDLLLRVAAFGLYTYSLFGVIAGSMDLGSAQHVLVLITSTLTIIQVFITKFQTWSKRGLDKLSCHQNFGKPSELDTHLNLRSYLKLPPNLKIKINP